MPTINARSVPVQVWFHVAGVLAFGFSECETASRVGGDPDAPLTLTDPMAQLELSESVQAIETDASPVFVLAALPTSYVASLPLRKFHL